MQLEVSLNYSVLGTAWRLFLGNPMHSHCKPKLFRTTCEVGGDQCSVYLQSIVAALADGRW